MLTNQNTNRPFKGLHQDTSPIDQPKGSYTMAWNAINETNDGNNNFISNEKSNELCGSLPDGYYPIGDVYADGSVIVFSTNGTNSEIGVIDGDCKYTTHVNNTCLNFQITHQIDAVFRVRRGCERTIYFTDGLNPVRYYNLEKPNDFKYSSGDWSCGLFDLFLNYQNPCFSNFEITEQGSLKSGSYEFAIQYLDKDLNPTKFTYATLAIPIFASSTTLPYNDIVGSSNIDTDAMGGSVPTSKAIRIFLDGMDTTYTHYRFAVIESTSFTGNPTRALLSAAILIPSTSTSFVYDGNTEGFTTVDVNEIRIQNRALNSADHIEQLENRLILANIKGKQLDFCSFQQYASLITTKYVVQSAPANALNPGGLVGIGNSKDPYTYWFGRGYMGDEVYAFGIVYVFKDGFETPVYHIPGFGGQVLGCGEPCASGHVNRYCFSIIEHPPLPSTCAGLQTSYTITYTLSDASSYIVNRVVDTINPMPFAYEVYCGELQVVFVSVEATNNNCTANIEDFVEYFLDIYIASTLLMEDKSYTITCPFDIIDTWEDNIAHLYPNEAEYNALADVDKLPRWKVYNTAVSITSDSGYMAYWESPSSKYPVLLDCDNNDYWGVDACGNALSDTPIRHHKFPDRNLIPQIVHLSSIDSYESVLVIKVQYNGSPSQLSTLLQAQFVGDPNESELLTVTYDLDGVTQTPVVIRLYANEFVIDSGVFVPLIKTVITRTGTSTQGIDNLVYTSAFGTDVNTTITNISMTNGLSVSPNTDLEVRNLGIQFDAITYPHPDIIGHYIVRGDRDSANRTVIDKGISNSTHESGASGTDYNLFSYFAGGPTVGGTTIINQSDNYNYLFTPDFLFDSNPPKGTYMKQEQQFLHVHSLGLGNLSTAEEFDDRYEFGAGAGKSAVFGDGYAVLSTIRKMTFAGLLVTPPAIKIRGIKKAVVLGGLSFDDSFVPNRKLYNVSQTNKVQIDEIAYPGMNSNGTYNIPYVSIKIDRDIYPNLFAIQYYRTHNCVLTNSTPNNVYGGDVFIAPLELGNTFFYQFHDSVWDAVLYIVIAIVAVVVTIYTGGIAAPALAAAISGIAGAVAVTAATVATTITIGAIVAGSIAVTALSIDQAIKAYRESGLQTVLLEDTQIDSFSYSTKNFMEYCSEFISGIYVETTINTGLRQDHRLYSPGYFYRGQMEIGFYFRDRIVVFDKDATVLKDKWVHKGFVTPEVYHYNKDFGKMNKENAYASVPESFDCCSKCLEQFPTRVHYSEQSFQEESIDNYRIFLANNYRDIEAENGVITNIFRKHNSLFIHSEETLWELPQNIQERLTGDLISFIGTGEYFSIPPRKILDGDIGTAGSKHKWATLKTDVGVYFVDEVKRDIFLLSDGLKSIANEGMRNYFKNNLIPFLENQFFRLTGTQFPNSNNHANPNGVGYHTVYDTRHERFLLTKRNYLILSQYEELFITVTSVDGGITGIIEGQLFYDLTTNQFGIGLEDIDEEDELSTYEFITLGDTLYFENKSWTMSFSLLNDTWTSFHSYLPLYYLYMHNKFFSSTTNGFWRHNKEGHFQTFYGILYPHIIEYISLSDPLTTKIYEAVMLHTIARIWDNVLEQYWDTDTATFNKAIFYNSKQCSGLLNLVIKDNDTANYLQNQIKNFANSILIDRNERNWTLNEIRDYRVNYGVPIWAKDWVSIQSEYPIDKVLNTISIDFNKDWTQLQLLRDKYLLIRLIFDSFDNVNLITNYSIEEETKSFR